MAKQYKKYQHLLAPFLERIKSQKVLFLLLINGEKELESMQLLRKHYQSGQILLIFFK
jgi:hypothetical protein